MDEGAGQAARLRFEQTSNWSAADGMPASPLPVGIPLSPYKSGELVASAGGVSFQVCCSVRAWEAPVNQVLSRPSTRLTPFSAMMSRCASPLSHEAQVGVIALLPIIITWSAAAAHRTARGAARDGDGAHEDTDN